MSNFSGGALYELLLFFHVKRKVTKRNRPFPAFSVRPVDARRGTKGIEKSTQVRL